MIDRTRRSAFTLIELLVVVAIIALLVAILLPSLSTAREQAKLAKCLASMKEIGTGLQAYLTSNDDWIPGSPITTGYSILDHGRKWTTNSYNAVEWMDWATAIRREFLGSGSMPKLDPANQDIDDHRAKLFVKAFEEPFLCPSNNIVANVYCPPDRPWDVSKYPATYGVSYMTMWTMMRPGPKIYNNPTNPFPRIPPSKAGVLGTIGHWAQSDAWEMAVPSSYVPKLSAIKRSGMKVFVADGFRYYDTNTQELTYNIGDESAKGSMSAEPPSSNSSYARAYIDNQKYSWRHGRNRQIAACFLDGHAEAMRANTNEPRPWTGEAVHPKYYYPTGTVVKDPSLLHVDLPRGTILP